MGNRDRVSRAGIGVILGVILLGVSHSLRASDFHDFFGPHTEATTCSAQWKRPKLPRKSDDLGHVLYWNRVAVDASGLDHATAHEQLGPGRASRAMAIVHIAMFDAVNAIDGGWSKTA